jgi:hypothetical protein
MSGPSTVIAMEIIIANTDINKTNAKDSKKRLGQARVIAAAADITGRIMGATSMAPITTAAELDSRPLVAIIVEITSNTAMR